MFLGKKSYLRKRLHNCDILESYSCGHPTVHESHLEGSKILFVCNLSSLEFM